MTHKQTKLRTSVVKPNRNISFPIGTIHTVDDYYEKLGFSRVFGKHKKKGLSIDSLVKALISYKLTENLSISKASDWINRPEVLKEFNLEEFEQRTLFRTPEIIGENVLEIVADIQDILFDLYDFEHTDTNLDWTSITLHGKKARLGKYGYSREHRPDKKQITLGLSELASPINVPVGFTVRAGNVTDVEHFNYTYGQIKRKLREGSLVIFDKGAHSKENVETILNDNLKYLSSKKLNTSDDKRIKKFRKTKAELIDEKDGIYGIKYEKPSRIDYFFFSEKLKKDRLKTKHRRALKKFEEAQAIQDSIDNNKGLPKRFQINNELVDVTYQYQTKLKELSKKDALKLVKSAQINGREGFFCLVSNKDLTLQEALATYRKKDSIEKKIDSLKNVVEIKPIRVWSDNSIYGMLVIGFIAQLFLSLIQYEHEELKHTSTKFIKNSLSNLTVTVEFGKSPRRRYIYSNFDPINEMILAQKGVLI